MSEHDIPDFDLAEFLRDVYARNTRVQELSFAEAEDCWSLTTVTGAVLCIGDDDGGWTWSVYPSADALFERDYTEHGGTIDPCECKSAILRTIDA